MVKTLTDEEIIFIRKNVKVSDFNKPYSDSIAFAKAIIEALNQKEKKEID